TSCPTGRRRPYCGRLLPPVPRHRSSPSRRVSLLIVVRPAPPLMRSASLTVQRLRHTGSNRFEANRFDRRVDVTCTARGQPRPVRCPTLRRALAHGRCAAPARAPNPVSAAPPRRSTVEVMTRIGLVIASPDRFPAADTLQDAVPLCAALRRAAPSRRDVPGRRLGGRGGRLARLRPGGAAQHLGPLAAAPGVRR